MGLGRLILGIFFGKNRIIWEFFLEGGGGPLFPNVYVRILTKSEHFYKNKKCSFGPKTQNKPLNFFFDGGLPNRGGPTFGKNSQKITYFFFDRLLKWVVTDEVAL